jgi:hypothetical protein
MPITNTPLTKSQFEYLQQNITDQVLAVESAGDIAQSGLHFIVLLQIDAPEIDLINPFFTHLQRTEGLSSTSTWLPVVTALNTHAITRGAAIAGASSSERLNTYLENGGNRIFVSSDYATLSEAVGFVIDSCYIDPAASGCLPGFTSALTASGVIGTPFSYTLTAVGTLPITFSVAGILPAGLTFNGVNSTVTMTATNSVGDTDKTLTITITV